MMPQTDTEQSQIYQIMKNWPIWKARIRNLEHSFYPIQAPVWIVGALVGCATASWFFLSKEIQNQTAPSLIAFQSTIALSVNFLTIIAIYYCWHEGRDFMRGIRIIDGSVRNSEFLFELRDAKFESGRSAVTIVDISIPTLIWGDFSNISIEEDRKYFEKSYEQFFEKVIISTLKKGIRIQILLLHPTSIIVKQRAKDLNKHGQDQDAFLREYMRDINSTLAFLFKIRERMKSMGFGEATAGFDIKLFDKVPSVTAYIGCQHVYASVYPHDRPSDQGRGPQALITHSLSKYIIEQKNELLTDKTISSLDDYMLLSLKGSPEKSYSVHFLPYDPVGETSLSALRVRYVAAIKISDAEALGRGGVEKEICLSRGSNPDHPLTAEIGAIIDRHGKIESESEIRFLSSLFKERYGINVSSDSVIYKVNSLSAEIEDTGWAYRPAAESWTSIHSDSVFMNSWDNLTRDTYLDDARDENGQPYPIWRDRRIGKFYYNLETEEIFLWNPLDTVFNQCSANHLYLDKERIFSPLEPGIATHSELKKLLLGNLRRLTINTPDGKHKYWRFIVHQIRVTPKSGGGSPAPEGPHQDGHDYISMHFINRKNVTGGESEILLTKDGPVIRTILLENAFDSIYLNDRRLFHNVLPITGHMTSPEDKCYRDMLLIDYEKISTWPKKDPRNEPGVVDLSSS